MLLGQLIAPNIKNVFKHLLVLLIIVLGVAWVPRATNDRQRLSGTGPASYEAGNRGAI